MPLDELLPQLIHRNDNEMTVRFNQLAKSYGVSAQAWRVLGALLDTDDQRVGDLAKHAGIELSTLSHLLTRMGQHGLVKRRRVSEDHRSMVVQLTPAGRALAEKIVPLAKKNEQIALDGFSEDEAQVLKALLQRVVENMEDQENLPEQDDASTRKSKRL